MESRVSNQEAKFKEFKKSQDEFRISQAKFRAEVLLQFKLLAEKLGVESSAATPTHQPFIKSTSPISLEKSNEIVLKLHSFHKDKVRAREKRDEFWSQFRPRYKSKTHPCLRPILKKFKKVHDYGKHHDNDSTTFRSNPRFQESSGFFRSKLARKNEMVFDLVNKKTEDSVTDHGYERVGSVKGRFKSPSFCIFDGLDIDFPIRFDVGVILDAKQMLIPAEGVGIHLGHNVFDELPHSRLSRKFSEEIDLLFVPADQTRIALQVFDERSHSANCDFQLGYHMPISDTGGTLHRFFTSNVQFKDAHSSKFLVCNGEVMKNDIIVHLKLGFHELISDKGGTISQRLFNSKSKNTYCALSFDYSMIIDGEYAGNLGLHNLEACMDKHRKNESKFTLSRFETGCCVVLNRDYCMGIRDKGGGSNFRAGKRKSPNVREDYLVHRFYRQKTVAALGENIKIRRFVQFTLGKSVEPVFMGFQEYGHGLAGWWDRVKHLFVDMHFKKLISQRWVQRITIAVIMLMAAFLPNQCLQILSGFECGGY